MGLTVNSPGLGGQSTLSHFLDFLKIQLCRNPFGGQWQLTLFRAFCGIYDWARHQGSTLGTILFDSERGAVIHRCRTVRATEQVAAVSVSPQVEGNTRWCANVHGEGALQCRAGGRQLAPAEELERSPPVTVTPETRSCRSSRPSAIADSAARREAPRTSWFECPSPNRGTSTFSRRWWRPRNWLLDTATSWLWFMSGSDREGTETGRRLP